MNTLENEIIEFVALERRKKPAALSLDSRLQDDLGFDGDDAVELFKMFEKRFTTDCSALWANWDKHFGSEGGPGLVFFVSALVIFGVGFGLTGLVSPGLRWYAGIFLVVVWIWPLKCWPWRDPKPSEITIRMMVDAARAKRWP
jgi:acyl carrier protein